MDHVLSEDDVEEGEVDQLRQELDKQAQEVRQAKRLVGAVVGGDWDMVVGGAVGVQPPAAAFPARAFVLTATPAAPPGTPLAALFIPSLHHCRDGLDNHFRQSPAVLAVFPAVGGGLLLLCHLPLTVYLPTCSPLHSCYIPAQEGLDDHFQRGRPQSAAARSFRATYLELWDKLMREAHAADAGLWDQYLLDKLCSVLISLNT